MRREHQVGLITLAIFTLLSWFWQQTPFSRSSAAVPVSTGTSTVSVFDATTTRRVADDGWVRTRGSTTTNAEVTRVVDGDTIEVRLDGGSATEKVRFLGINTPESVDPRRPVQCFGKEASAFSKHLLDRQRIHLEPDLQADERDKYHRLLRNIVLEDGTDVNASLVSLGYAQAYLSFPLNEQRKQQLRELERVAKIAERGLWSPTTCAGQK